MLEGWLCGALGKFGTCVHRTLLIATSLVLIFEGVNNTMSQFKEAKMHSITFLSIDTGSHLKTTDLSSVARQHQTMRWHLQSFCRRPVHAGQLPRCATNTPIFATSSNPGRIGG